MGRAGLIKAIRQISRELNKLAVKLESGESDWPQQLTTSNSANGPVDDGALRRVAIGIYKRRRLREKAFLRQLFSEPAWDIILYLFINHVRGHKTGEASSCTASRVPHAIAIRWIAMLETQGFIVCNRNESEPHTKMIELSEEGLATVRRILEQIANLS